MITEETVLKAEVELRRFEEGTSTTSRDLLEE